jgi:hypothetical protein
MPPVEPRRKEPPTIVRRLVIDDSALFRQACLQTGADAGVMRAEHGGAYHQTPNVIAPPHQHDGPSPNGCARIARPPIGVVHFAQAEEPAAASALRNSVGIRAGAIEFSLFLTAHTRASKPSKTISCSRNAL